MTPLLRWAAALGLPLALLAVGSRLAGRLAAPAPEEPAAGLGHRATLALLAGTLSFYLLLLLLDAAGIPWTPLTLTAALLAAGALLWLLPGRPLAPLQARARLRGHPTPGPASGENPRSPSAPAWARAPLHCNTTPDPIPGADPRSPSLTDGRPGWGDLVALLALLAFAAMAATLWVTLTDFIYHWGYKAEHFVLARGIDYAWLAKSWNHTFHPDYPNLLPALYAATAILGGGFAAAPLMVWSVAFFALILASAREALRRSRLERLTLQATVALLGLTLATFGLGYRLAGGADWAIALALVAAAPGLLGRPEPGPSSWRADLRIGIPAAFAAAAKLEGLPLAAFLVLIHAARHARLGRRAFLRSLSVAALPVAAVVLPWLVQIHRWDLLQPGNTAPFDRSRIGPIAGAMLEAAAAPELHGLPWLVALLPLLALSRRTRPLAAVCGAQLLFYACSYVASPYEPRFYVLSNFARLLFQLIPAILVGAAVALDSRRASSRSSFPVPARDHLSKGVAEHYG